MRVLLLTGILACALSACASTMPFSEAVRAPLESKDAKAVVERFNTVVARDFRLVTTIVFDYKWFMVSGIGYVDINAAEGRYKVVCMNQLGVKILEFEGDRTGIIRQYAIEPLAERGNVAAAIGKDIQRIYLDLTPAHISRKIATKDTLIVRERADEGALEYEFAGPDGNLVSKTYREDQRTAWRVSYYDYEQKNGKLYPRGMLFTNYRYGYRLIVRVKDIRD